MKKFGILTDELINTEAQHYLKFAMVLWGGVRRSVYFSEEIERENILKLFLPHIRYKPNFDNGHKKVLFSAISRQEDRIVELICSAIGHDWKFWNSSRVETPLITAILQGSIFLSFYWHNLGKKMWPEN